MRPSQGPDPPASAVLKIVGAAASFSSPCSPAGENIPYALVLGTDVLIAVLFATSLHFIMGPGGMHSFGHAAYFGLGAYGVAVLAEFAAAPMLGAIAFAPLVAVAGALIFGWFAVRLSGVYLAMLTLAFAQIVWSIVFQWENVTGGSNGVVASGRPAVRRRLPTTCSGWHLQSVGCCGCAGCCAGRSARRCAPAATPRCARRRSAST